MDALAKTLLALAFLFALLGGALLLLSRLEIERLPETSSSSAGASPSTSQWA